MTADLASLWAHHNATERALRAAEAEERAILASLPRAYRAAYRIAGARLTAAALRRWRRP